jgi:FkbM family methyltransferase
MGLKTMAAGFIARCIRSFILLLGDRFLYVFTDKLQGDLVRDIEINTDAIKFYSPNGLTAWRAFTLLDKEPETIGWIDAFDPDGIMWDIGANIGVYSLYCSVVKGCRVISFEPSAGNFYVLCKNIELNKVDNKVTALCIALSDETKLDTLNMVTTEVGGALSNFATKSEHASFRQSCLGFKADEAIERYNLPLPNYLKLDVDGIEHLVLKGARRLLDSPELSEVLVELDDGDPAQVKMITETLEGHGLKWQWKKHSDMFDSGQYTSIYNHLFKRL